MVRITSERIGFITLCVMSAGCLVAGSIITVFAIISPTILEHDPIGTVGMVLLLYVSAGGTFANSFKYRPVEKVPRSAGSTDAC